MEIAMARPASGLGTLDQAWEAIRTAQTVEQLRQAQAVVLPLAHGLSLEQTGQVLGISVGWVCRLRVGFIKGSAVKVAEEPARGGRKRENLSVEQEREFLQPFFAKASQGGILVAGEIKVALEEKLGRSVATASVYNLLHRHNWRKLVPDTHHPQSDPDAQLDWKKNSAAASKKSVSHGKKQSPSS
jgi:transposase